MSWRGIFLDPIDSNIQARLNARQYQLSKGTHKEFGSKKYSGAAGQSTTMGSGNKAGNQFYAGLDEPVGKTAWVKMLSNAVIADDVLYNGQRHTADSDFVKNMRLNFQLFGGQIDADAEGNTPQKFRMASPKKLWYRPGPQFRNTPAPGITRVSIDQSGMMGSIRKAKIDFTVFTEADLHIYQMLYMTPGISVVLEWGWSHYRGTFLPECESQDEYVVKIRDRSLGGGDSDDPSQAGLYDGMLGVVSNFQYTVRQDTGYDCQVDLMSPNSFVVDAPLKKNNLGFTISPKGGDESSAEPLSDIKAIRAFIEGESLTDDGDISNPAIQGATLKKGLSDSSTRAWMKKYLNLGERETWMKYNIKGKKEDVVHLKICAAAFDEQGTYQIPQIKLRKDQPNKFGGKVGEYFAVKNTTKGKNPHIYSFQTMIGKDLDMKATYVSWRFIEDVLCRVLSWDMNDHENINGKNSDNFFVLSATQRYKKAKGGKSKKTGEFVTVDAKYGSWIPNMFSWRVGKTIKDNENNNEPTENAEFLLPMSADPTLCIWPTQYKNWAMYEDFLEKYYDAKAEASDENQDKKPSFKDEYRRRLLFVPGQLENTSRAIWQSGKKLQVSIHKAGNKPIKGLGKVNGQHATLMPLRNVYVNFDLVEDVLRTLTAEPNRNNIKEFLLTLCENVNSCFGNQWDPVIVDNPNTPGIELRDMNVITSPHLSSFTEKAEWENISADADNPAAFDEDAELEMFNDEYAAKHIDTSGTNMQFAYDFGALTKFSLVRNVTMTSKIPSGLQAMMFIGATSALKDDDEKAGNSAGGEFAVQSARIQDRLYVSETAKKEDTVDPTLTADETWMISMWNAYGEYTTNAFEMAKDGLDNVVDKTLSKTIAGGYKQQMKVVNISVTGEESSETNTTEEDYSPLLPFNVGFTTDGIAGIYMGNAFALPDVLPRRHAKSALFMVTKVGHTIQGGDWETTIDGMMRLSKQAGK
tara:strand:- start:6801 stop:9725 length:2925 start_codon:yes stop_codon:yes gene_type:complete